MGAAHRGEIALGEHAEYTLLQRKLLDLDVRGTTLYTTLEPCTTRNHPKRACAEWVIARGVAAVVVGMLDPNPVVYERGVLALRNAGLKVGFFPTNLRDLVKADNAAFIAQFHAATDLSGTVSFNFQHNDGKYTIGHGDLMFVTRWSNAGSEWIHVRTDGTGLRGLGLAQSARTFTEVDDASAYDMSSRVRTPREGEFVVLENDNGHFAAVRVVDVRARSHGDPFDALTFEFRINSDGSPRFTDQNG